MPQFDFTQALPQIIWLAIVFGILYLAVRGLYPRVEKIVENRKARIGADLKEADMIKVGLSAPLHEGAVRYYKERGWM